MITLRVFGRLTLLKRLNEKTKTSDPMWLCGCYCGNYCIKSQYSLNRKIRPVTSCGDCQDHIKYKTEYNIYTSMLQRCRDKNCPAYPDYGGRGIDVCQRWKQDFLFFLEDMGFRPYELTLDRKDNNGNYCKENCIWSDRIDQNNNRRNNISEQQKLARGYRY